jgi:hypothetical protein
MSNALALDPRELLCKQLDFMGPLYINDLKWVPADKLCECPMGAARTPQQFTAEVIGFNNWVAAALAGDPPAPGDGQHGEVDESLDTFEKMQQALQASVAKLNEAIKGCSDEDLASMTQAPWGEPMPKFRLAMIPALHMMYHSGQLNYVQALYGDADNHWGG